MSEIILINSLAVEQILIRHIGFPFGFTLP